MKEGRNHFQGQEADAWLSRLSGTRLPNTFNPWREHNDDDLRDDAANARVCRLRSHLSCEDPKLLLVGEAPGYLGARVSGLAFTSERLLFEGTVPRLENQAQQRISSRERPYSEPSATIVWSEAYKLGIANELLLWNAFPYHPYKDSPTSNRAPTRLELDFGLSVLDELILLVQPRALVAVGRNAERSIATLGHAFTAIRHPSMGGAPAFRDGLASVLR